MPKVLTQIAFFFFGTRRRILGSILSACIYLLIFAFYMEYRLGLEPCPMCIVQRIAIALVGFIALIAMVNYMLFFVGDISGLNSIIESKTIYNELSLEAVMGIIFSPLMWLIGVSSADIVPMGQLLGIKLSVNEFIAYMQLADFKVAGAEVILKYEKSLIMATYMLCGFANFSSIGIQIGGIGAVAPNQRKNLAKFGLKALIGGALASLLSAAIAGMLIG